MENTMDINLIYGDENEKPLDKLVSDGGFTGIFRTIACVGDSLASGEFEVKRVGEDTKMFLDRYDYSWGQYMARMAGCTAYNFSKGGMTAREYMHSYANANGFFRPELAANAYVIALGVNDLLNRKWEIGSVDDVDLENYKNNKDTFAGNFAAIIQRYKEISPDARFFLVTMPTGRAAEYDSPVMAHRELMFKFAEMFSNTYVIDMYTYAPRYDAEFKKNFYLCGHLNPMGYLLTAKMFVSYIDYIIRHNMPDFKNVGLMGFEYDRDCL